MKRLNGGRQVVDRHLCAQVFANVRARQNLPFNDNQLNAFCAYLELGYGRQSCESANGEAIPSSSSSSSRPPSASSQPFHHVIGRIRQAQRNAQMRHRWKKDQDFRVRSVGRFRGFCRPGTAHVHYGTQGNTSLMESRQMFVDRMTDGTPSPRSSRPSTAASVLTGESGHLLSGSRGRGGQGVGSRKQRRGPAKARTWGRL